MSSTSITETPAAAPRMGVPALALLLGLPGAALVLGTMLTLAVVPAGIDPMWEVEELTLPEAAALRDNGEVMRLIGLGGDPNQAARVRPGFAHNDEKTLTPLEAAVGVRRADMVELLLENGARMDAATWARLICFAGVVKAEDVRQFLEHQRPEGAADACGGVETPW